MRTTSLRIGIYDHLGWAIAVAASGKHDVVDRRKIELLEPGVPSMPIHHPGPNRSLAEITAAGAEHIALFFTDDDPRGAFEAIAGR